MLSYTLYEMSAQPTVMNVARIHGPKYHAVIDITISGMTENNSLNSFFIIVQVG